MKRLKKGTPGKGGDSPRDSFSHVPVGSGLKNIWSGWIAGETYWALAHEHKPPAMLGTKPCLTWLTDGAVPCARCKPRVVPTWIGWVPIYREVDHAPCIVIVHESVMDLVADLTYGTRVMVGRSADTSSVYVRRADAQTPRFKSEHEQRQGPRDITPDLLSMWGIPMLDEWLRGAGATKTTESDNGLSLRTKDDAASAAADEFTGAGLTSGSQAVNDAFARSVRRAAKREVESNGKHGK